MLGTAQIPNPIIGRSVEPTDWALEVTVVTAILSGLLFATYVRDDSFLENEKAAKVGTVGGFLSFFAVACPACNKIVLLLVGTSGAIQWFAPIQPYLGALGVVLVAAALITRLRNESACMLPRV